MQFYLKRIMSGPPTVHSSYRGWALTVHCIRRWRPLNASRRLSEYVASGYAVLIEANRGAWMDAQSQVEMSGERSFHSADECSTALVLELKVLIDGLRQ